MRGRKPHRTTKLTEPHDVTAHQHNQRVIDHDGIRDCRTLHPSAPNAGVGVRY